MNIIEALHIADQIKGGQFIDDKEIAEALLTLAKAYRAVTIGPDDRVRSAQTSRTT